MASIASLVWQYIVDGPINQCEIFTQNDETMPKAVKLYYGTMYHGHIYFHLIGGANKKSV